MCVTKHYFFGRVTILEFLDERVKYYNKCLQMTVIKEIKSNKFALDSTIF